MGVTFSWTNRINKMASFKLLVILLVAFAATSQQVQSATVPHDSRTLGDVIENVVAILNIIISAVQNGLTQADPRIDAIQNELHPDLAAFVEDIRDRLKEDINVIVTRLNYLSGEVTGALTQIRSTIPTCLNATVQPIDAILNNSEGLIAKVLVAIQTAHRADLDDFYNNLDSVTLNIDKVIDTALNASLDCVKPGSPAVKACLDNSTSTLFSGLQGSILDLGLVIIQLVDLLTTLLPEAIEGISPIVNATIDGIQGPLNDFGLCVTGLRPVKLY